MIRRIRFVIFQLGNEGCFAAALFSEEEYLEFARPKEP
jgi:hypothetical protein